MYTNTLRDDITAHLVSIIWQSSLAVPRYQEPFSTLSADETVHYTGGGQTEGEGAMIASNWQPPTTRASLVQVGEIQATDTTVFTPVGSCPLKGAVFTMMDTHQETQVRPGWTIVVAILLFPFGLFALLCKDTKCSGYVNVTVQNAGFSFTTQVGVAYQAQVWQTNDIVKYLRALAQWATAQP